MPVDTPLTTPVVGFTVAIDVFVLLQVPPAVASLSAIVPPGHTVVGPVIAGSEPTVTVTNTKHAPVV